MTERRLLCKALPSKGGRVVLGREAVRHARVLRLGVGDRVTLFDGEGHEAPAVVEAWNAAELVCSADAPGAGEVTGPTVVLVQALPKGAKLDAIVRMTTECGVAAIHLAESQRSERHPRGDRVERQLDRLGRIACEAARQSGRTSVPALHPPAPLGEAVARAPAGAIRVVAASDARDLIGWAASSETWIAVGPEGGFAADEVQELERSGYRPVRIGPHTLRVETAAAVAVALCLAPGPRTTRN